jgi:hypothetical protein
MIPRFTGASKTIREQTMSEHMRMKRAAAKFEQESQFDTPQQLATEPGLPRGERIASLNRWAHLVDRRISGVNEGMPSRGDEAIDAELLREI